MSAFKVQFDGSAAGLKIKPSAKLKLKNQKVKIDVPGFPDGVEIDSDDLMRLAIQQIDEADIQPGDGEADFSVNASVGWARLKVSGVLSFSVVD